MICEVNKTVEDKIESIKNRTPDQKMIREGVPVSIGGHVYEIKPLVRKQARAFRQKWAETATKFLHIGAGLTDKASSVDSVVALLDNLGEAEPLQLNTLTIAIPELTGKEDWIDDNATNEELAEAMLLALHMNGLGNPTSPRQRGSK